MTDKHPFAPLAIGLFGWASLASPLDAQKPYRGAEVYSNHEVVYGRFEMHMRMVKGGGMLSTFFTYKGDSFLDGVFWEEIDIEVLGKENATIASTNIITGGTGGPLQHNVEEIRRPSSLADDFHTYTLEWTPDSITWRIDGQAVRREAGPDVEALVSPQSYRFNAWISCSPTWVGELNPTDLPQFQYVDWIEYHSYHNGAFTFEWRDDFSTFDAARWSRADWTFDCNQVDFIPQNAFVVDGNLVLAITDPGAPNTAVKGSDLGAKTAVITQWPPGTIALRFPEWGTYTLRLLPARGGTVLRLGFTGTRVNIPVAGVGAGTYFLEVRSGKRDMVERLRIE